MFTKLDTVDYQLALVNNIEWRHDDISDVTIQYFSAKNKPFSVC